VRPFATLRVTPTATVILSEAKNLPNARPFATLRVTPTATVILSEAKNPTMAPKSGAYPKMGMDKRPLD
jgi:hypothetical protein